MPEVHFRVRWPGGEEETCYSPSTIILEHLEAGATYAVPEFVLRARTALELASERVRARYGYACSSALDQLQAIVLRVDGMSPGERSQGVTVLSLARQEPRDARR